jgi:hypothetical protein
MVTVRAAVQLCGTMQCARPYTCECADVTTCIVKLNERSSAACRSLISASTTGPAKSNPTTPPTNRLGDDGSEQRPPRVECPCLMLSRHLATARPPAPSQGQRTRRGTNDCIRAISPHCPVIRAKCAENSSGAEGGVVRAEAGCEAGDGADCGVSERCCRPHQTTVRQQVTVPRAAGPSCAICDRTACVAAVISDGAADGMGPTRDDSSRCISTSRIVRSNCEHYHVSQQSSRVLKVVRGGRSYLSACRLLRLGLGEHGTLELRTQPIQMRHGLHRRRANQFSGWLVRDQPRARRPMCVPAPSGSTLW